MGSKIRKYDMEEINDTRSSGQMSAHKSVIERLLEKGYTIESQEDEIEEGLGNELISKSLVTILKPSTSQLPMIKFEATEIFGKYNYETQVFEPREAPVFNMKAFKRGADIKSFNDPWDSFDMS
ncbi:hypothetical protein HON22_05405 [Candidatus Peregrinibacteria bacterium]|jgi:hypothetical protein|nr:hypothetical protein [Candidatus Peregrinibacteria bacterium]